MKIFFFLIFFLTGLTWAQTRIIPHITRPDGNFSSRLLLVNDQNRSETLEVEGFDSSGHSLGSLQVDVPSMGIVKRDPLSMWSTPDAVASIVLGGSDRVRATISYVNGSGSGSPAHLLETTVTSKSWEMFPGNWDRVFDGVALVNLGDQPMTVRVAHYDFQSVKLDEQIVASEVPVMGKTLYVLGGPGVEAFASVPDSFFIITANQPMAITALRGDLPFSEFLWASSIQPREAASSVSFDIEAIPDGLPDAFSAFDKYMEVFGVRMFASVSVSPANMIHAARVMAGYLDNDGDGTPDDSVVIDAMKQRNASMVMFGSENDSQFRFFETNFDQWETWALQDLRNDEIFPNGRAEGRFDATYEEVLHLISDNGYVMVYPEAFGTEPGSILANAMDVARGGQFQNVPATYPDGAWYTYDDTTCAYNCQATEYFYWALTSILGAQDFPGRLDQIGHEWRLNTRDLVESGDPTIFQLLTDPKYKLPTRLPDGNYGHNKIRKP